MEAGSCIVKIVDVIGVHMRVDVIWPSMTEVLYFIETRFFAVVAWSYATLHEAIEHVSDLRDVVLMDRLVNEVFVHEN